MFNILHSFFCSFIIIYFSLYHFKQHSFVYKCSQKILNFFTNGIGMYFSNIIEESFRINAFGDNGWINSWRVFIGLGG